MKQGACEGNKPLRFSIGQKMLQNAKTRPSGKYVLAITLRIIIMSSNEPNMIDIDLDDNVTLTEFETADIEVLRDDSKLLDEKLSTTPKL